MIRHIVLAASVAAGVVGAGHAQAQTRTERQFEGWTVGCLETEKIKSCALSQLVRAQKNKRVVFGWTVFSDKGGARKARIRTPTGIDLEKGITVTVPGSKPIPVSYRFCGPQACIAEFAFSDAWVGAMKKQTEMNVSFTPVGTGKEVTVKMSLKGFSDAYDYFDQQAG